MPISSSDHAFEKELSTIIYYLYLFPASIISDMKYSKIYELDFNTDVNAI